MSMTTTTTSDVNFKSWTLPAGSTVTIHVSTGFGSYVCTTEGHEGRFEVSFHRLNLRG